MRGEALLRAALVAVLAALLIFPSLWRSPAADAGVLRIGGAFGDADLARALARPGLFLLLRDAAVPPGDAELERLAAAASRVPLAAVLPADPSVFEAAPPAELRTGRAAAITFRLRAAAGDTPWVRLRDAVGVIDSARVPLDSAGVGSAAFRVRPLRAGWHEWSLGQGDARRTVGAWADSADAPRVLLHAGLPGWEARFVMRALEESGARVTARYTLGRGLSVDGGAPGLTASALRSADVVLVMDGAPLSPAERALLSGWAEQGGGVLFAGDRAATPGFGLVARAGPPAPVTGAALAWRLPPELAALPASGVRATATPLGPPLPGAQRLASAPNGGTLAVRPIGAGRVAALSLVDSWRWRMEGGAVGAHREFWRALVDYLAGGGVRPLVLAAHPATPAVGVPVEITAWNRTSTPLASVAVRGPDGHAHAVPLLVAEDRLLHGRFTPPAAGLYTVGAPGSAPGTAFRAGTPGRNAGNAWARLSLLASRSGGGMISADSAAALLRARPSPPLGRQGPGGWMLLVVLLAGAEWALRRIRGRS